LRIAADHRGRGHGTAAVRWLTGTVFGGFPDATRIEGNTRHDNIPMRRTFAAAGYQKEARYREAWPGRDGLVHDSVGYAMLRRDWRDGTTTPVRWDDGY
jgi:RimJ/RimL family protein N-acetyltransferase